MHINTPRSRENGVDMTGNEDAKNDRSRPIELISSRILYKGEEISFRLDELALPHGRRSCQELLVYPATVCIAALTEKEHFVLIRQYRHSTGKFLWEAPAGKLLPGEDPLQGARRELEEETGYRAETWERLFEGYTAPGLSTEWMSFFLARGLSLGVRHPEIDECIEVHEIPGPRAWQMLMEGHIQDVKTACVLLLPMEKLRFQAK